MGICSTDQEEALMHTIKPEKAASYRLHAKRWGVARMARKMAADGYSLTIALEVLVGRSLSEPM